MKTRHENSKGRLVSKVFEDVFDKYDLMNDLMSLGVHRAWKMNFIHWLNPQKNTTLIDVASGTGDIAKLYLNKINYKGHVCCVDESKEMLNINREKLKRNTNVKWFCSNAEKLPFKKGVGRIYETLNISCVPVALNSGKVWPKYGIIKHPGKITVSFLKPVEPGLNRDDFIKNLETKIYNEIENIS